MAWSRFSVLGPVPGTNRPLVGKAAFSASRPASMPYFSTAALRATARTTTTSTASCSGCPPRRSRPSPKRASSDRSRRPRRRMLLLRHVCGGRELGRRPAAAEGLDEQDRGRHPPAADLNRGDLVGQRDGLDGDHVKVADGACLVLVRRQVHGLARRLHRLVLHTVLLLQ